MNTIAEQIKEHRARAGLSQAQLGAACDPPLVKSQVGRLELGYEVTASVLVRIATALDVTLEIPPGHPLLARQAHPPPKKKARRGP